MGFLFGSPKQIAPPPLPPAPPPLPTPSDPSVARVRENIRRRAAVAGRQATIKSPGGAQGLTGDAPGRRKTLLGN